MAVKKNVAKKAAKKKSVLTTSKGKLLFDPTLLSSEVPIPNAYGGHKDVRILHPEEYKFIKNMEQGQSFPFETGGDLHKLAIRIRGAIKKEDATMGYVIKQVDDKYSRIWRDDTQAPRKKRKYGNRYTVKNKGGSKPDSKE